MSEQQLGFIILAIVAGIVISFIIWLIVRYHPADLFDKRWNQVKYIIKQLVLMYSDQPSIFAKKRVESGLYLYSALGAMLSMIWIRRHTITITEFMLIVTGMLAVAGYNIREIQNEKKMNKLTDSSDGNENRDKDDQK